MTGTYKQKPSGLRITTRTLKRLAWRQGLSVTELCARIHRHKTSVYRAVRQPDKFPVTYSLLLSHLHETGLSN